MRKKIGWALLAAPGLLVAILLINTMRFSTRQVAAPPIERIELNETQIAHRLAGAIRLPTTSQADGTVDGAALLALHDYADGVRFYVRLIKNSTQ